MSTRHAARITVAAIAVALSATSAGCDVISRVQTVAGNVQSLSEMAGQLKDSSELTYTADYVNSSKQTVQLVQDPPRSAYRGPSGAYIATPDATLLCQRSAGKVICQKAPKGGPAAITDATTLSLVTGQGFVPPSVAIALLAAAALYPDATVTSSEKTIAGQKSRCATATGFSAPDSETAPPVQDFTICITADGVLASFSGTLQDGSPAGVTLTKYRKTADPAAFAPPAGATVVDVSQLPVPSR